MLSFLSSIILFSKGKLRIIPGSQNEAIMSSITVIKYNDIISKGIMKDIFWEIKSEIKNKNKKMGTLNAVKDSIVGRKLQGPIIKPPFQRI